MAARLTSWLSRPSLLRTLFSQVRLAIRLVREPRVGMLVKALPVLAAVYVVSPLDFVPDVIPVLGQLDDLGILADRHRRLPQAVSGRGGGFSPGGDRRPVAATLRCPRPAESSTPNGGASRNSPRDCASRRETTVRGLRCVAGTVALRQPASFSIRSVAHRLTDTLLSPIEIRSGGNSGQPAAPFFSTHRYTVAASAGVLIVSSRPSAISADGSLRRPTVRSLRKGPAILAEATDTRARPSPPERGTARVLAA